MRSELSALIDDELAADVSERVVHALNRDAALRRDWETYHLIGDTLRRTPTLSAGFTARLMARLASEAAVLAPVSTPPKKNDAARFAVALAASIMGIGVVGWVALSFNAPAQVASVARPAPERLAAVPQAEPERVVVAPQQAPAKSTPSPVRPGPDALAEYLLAHQAHSPSGGIQGVAPYVRTVSDIRQDVRR
jgi:sigma-E factor negative regulatory protein RseA